MSNSYIIIVVAIMIAVVWLMRFLPYIVFGEKRKVPKIVEYLGKALPYATMVMLVVYCLKDVEWSVSGSWVPAIVGTLVVVVLQVWKRNSILAIVGGTVAYMLLVNLVFV